MTQRTFHNFVLACGNDPDTLNTAAILALGDAIAGRTLREADDYRNDARELMRVYGHGLAAAALIAARWIPDPNAAAGR